MIEEIKKLPVGKIIEHPQMRKYTTYQTGGEADLMVFPSNIDQLVCLLSYIKENKIPYKIIGNGSNLIFQDEPYHGVIIKLEELNSLEIYKNYVVVGAGYSLMRLALKVSKMGYSGLEFAAGIPGTIGGSIFMNAGAYKSDMGYITEKVKVLTPDLKIKELTNQEMQFHYRTSFCKTHPEYVVLEATLKLSYRDPKEIMELIGERKKRRLETQPLEYPSAGSVFRNPEGDYAGRLIEEIGYKGKQIGGAMVSQKHANFIINVGGATSQDIKTLIQEIKEKVYEKYKIELKEEQEYVEYHGKENKKEKKTKI